MFAKLRRSGLLTDLRPLLSTPEAKRLTEQTAIEMFTSVFSELIVLLPGDSWAKTEQLRNRFGIA